MKSTVEYDLLKSKARISLEALTRVVLGTAAMCQGP